MIRLRTWPVIFLLVSAMAMAFLLVAMSRSKNRRNSADVDEEGTAPLVSNA
jgi:lipopolysaccharide export LptBFGC system permease protein LptF